MDWIKYVRFIIEILGFSNDEKAEGISFVFLFLIFGIFFTITFIFMDEMFLRLFNLAYRLMIEFQD